MTNKRVIFQIACLVMIMSNTPEYVAQKGNEKMLSTSCNLNEI